MQVGPKGVSLIKEFEAYKGWAYPDPGSPLFKKLRQMKRNPYNIRSTADIPAEARSLSGNPWTYGYGSTKGVRVGMYITEPQALALLLEEVKYYAEVVSKSVMGVSTTQEQFDAMTSLCYNIGPGWDPARPKPAGAKNGFRQSSVLKAHLRGDYPSAARAFNLWNKSGGVEMAGLVRRRAREADLYLSHLPTDQTIQVPKAPPNSPESVLELDTQEDTFVASRQVDSESDMKSSSIVKATTIAGGTAALASGTEVLGQISSFKWAISQLGDWVLPIALIVIAGLCYYIYKQRKKQRKEGWS